MSDSNETVQSNTSCYVDSYEAADQISYPPPSYPPATYSPTNYSTGSYLPTSYPTQTIQPKQILMDPFHGYENILLENLLKQLSEKINHYEETHKMKGDCQVIPINVPMSEASQVNYEIIDFTNSLVSFPCLNYDAIICCKDFNKGSSQSCNAHFIFNSYFIADSSSGESFGCNVDEYMKEDRSSEWRLMKNNTSLLIRTIFNTSFVFTAFNFPFCTSIIHRQSVQYLHCAWISTEPIEFNFSQTLQIGINFASNLCGVIYTSSFDLVKLFLANIQTILSMTLSINQAPFILAATFPIKNSGFDFYSKRNLQIKDLPFRMEINSDLSSLKTFKSGSSDPDYLPSSQQNLYNAPCPSRFPSSVLKNQQIISLFKTNFSPEESVSSKCSVKSFPSQTDESRFGKFSESLVKKIPVKVQNKGENKEITNLTGRNLMKTSLSTNKCEKDYSQGTLTELKSKYLLTEQSSKIKHLALKVPPNSSSKQPKIKIKNNNFAVDKLAIETELLVSKEALLSDSVVNESLSIINLSVSKLIVSVATEIWDIKSIRREYKPCQFVSTEGQQSKIRNNYQNYILNRRNKIGCNKGVFNSLRENKSGLNKDFLTPHQKRKGFGEAQLQHGDPFPVPNICDLITSQSLFGQPPKSCFKSKLSVINKLHDIRNLSWDVHKRDRENVQKIEEIETLNNQSVKLDIVNEPASIFDYAKSRCLSADLSSKLNLTNSELIQASKKPFSHSGFLKTLKEDLLSKRASRLSDAPTINSFKSTNSFLNRKRVRSNHNRNIDDLKANNSKFNYRVTEKTSSNMIMNRFKTGNKAIVTNQNFSKQQGKLLFSQNKRKGDASFKSSDSSRDCKNIFCFS